MKTLILAIIAIVLAFMVGCKSTPRDRAPIVLRGEPIVVIRDYYIRGTPFVHSFVQVFDGSNWHLYEKLHRQAADQTFLHDRAGWQEAGRNRATLKGSQARKVIGLLAQRFTRPSALTYSNPNNNSNTWVAQLLADAGLDPDRILSEGALGK